MSRTVSSTGSGVAGASSFSNKVLSNGAVAGDISNGALFGRCSNGALFEQFSNGALFGQFSNGALFGQFSNGALFGQFSNGAPSLGEVETNDGAGGRDEIRGQRF